MKNKIITFILALCLIIPSSSVFAMNEEILEEKDQLQIEEIKEEPQIEESKEDQNEKVEEVKEEAKEEIKEETEQEASIEIVEEKPSIEESKTEGKENKILKKQVNKANETSIQYPIKITWHIKYRDANGEWTEYTSSTTSTLNNNTSTVKPSFSVLQNKVIRGELYNAAENTTYIFNSKYEDDFGNSYVTLSKAIAAGSDYSGTAAVTIKTDKSIDVYFTAQYRIKPIVHNLTGIYSDHIGHTSGSWSTVDNQETTSYTHTFKVAADVPAHYEFLYWEDQENNDIAYAKEKRTWDLTAISEDIEVTYKATYNYQPPIRVIYHYNNKIKDTGAQWSDIDIYENQPAKLYWFYENTTEPIAQGTVAPLPSKILKITEPQNYGEQVDVYAHYYTITWVNEDGTVLEIDENIPYGEMPSYDGMAPTKKADIQYTYTFAGWDKEIDIVTNDVTYTATYNKTLNKYNIQFLNFDGTVLQNENLEYGTMPVYKQNTPIKEATAQFTYIFKEWAPIIVEVAEDAIYTAQYDESINKYTVTFVDEDGTILSVAQYPYGTAAADIKLPTTPTKAADNNYTYTFNIWSPTIADVIADATYKATYIAIAIEKPILTNPDDDIVITEPEYDSPVAATTNTTTAIITSAPVTETTTESTIIEDTTTPQASPKNETGSWALINLILVILNFLVVMGLLPVRKKTKNEEYTEEEEKDVRGLKRFKIYSVLVLVVSVIAFILTEDITLPIDLIDKWTILMAVFSIIEIINIFVVRNKSKEEEEEENE